MYLQYAIICLAQQPILSLGTLGQLDYYLAASVDAKTGLRVNKIDNWWHP